ncbi:hypothetical protein CPC16_011503 [Podila verticillata]|nr:hypothetical protein CPC16_011503 [Podila verticillata]
MRKFQSSTSTPLGASFSTSTSSKSSRSSVDDAIGAIAGKSSTTRSSPIIAAASAADASLSRHLDSLKSPKASTNQEHHHHEHDASCGCGDASSHPKLHLFSEDVVGSVDAQSLPPISDEARRFTEKLLGQNKAWAIKKEQDRPGFFAKLEKQQNPQVLWIGCSDSRVPANQIVNLDPGEIFVHRNIANVVTHTDMNLLSVLEYAVDVLKVRHIIICGHYGCGGVAASLTQKQFGIIDNWLRNIKDLYTIHRKKFDTLPAGGKEQQDLLTELNVIQSALNVCHTSIIQKAWSRGAELSVHGWCYRLSDGVIRNLGLCVEGPGNVEDVYHVIDEHPQDRNGRQDNTTPTRRELTVGEHGLVVEVARGAEPKEQDPETDERAAEGAPQFRDLDQCIGTGPCILQAEELCDGWRRDVGG